MIEVEALVYDYVTKRALHGVSFTVKSGETLALVGPNGAGKSTLLRCMAALDRPFSGSVRIDGVDTLENPRSVHEKIGYLPDFFGLYDELSVRQCLTYAARARGLRAAETEAAVRRAAERVALLDRLDTRAQELSRGLRQRLAIGQTIVHAPGALLLDEPAAGLDPEARKGLSDLIRSLAGDGMAIIVSSHILAELEEYCSAMLILRDGRLVQDGPIEAQERKNVRLRIALAGASPLLAQMLGARADVTVERAGGDVALIRLNGDALAQAALLGDLVAAGLPVSAFAEEERTMEQIYLGAVGDPAAAEPHRAP